MAQKEKQKLSREELDMQKELRDLYKNTLEKGTQQYIAKMTGISASVLSNFKNEKINLYPYLSEKLEAYLKSSKTE